jgi:hypothetical protein
MAIPTGFIASSIFGISPENNADEDGLSSNEEWNDRRG